MASPKLTLHRTAPLEVVIAKPGDTRAFAFDVELSLGRPDSFVDPESGMLVNLVDVDAILSVLVHSWQGPSASSCSSLEELVEVSLQQVQHQLVEKFGAASNLFVEKIIFHEKRGKFFGWRQSLFCGRRQLLECEFAGEKKLFAVFAEFFSEDFKSVPELHWSSVDLSETKAFQKQVFQQNPTLQQIKIEHLVTRVQYSFSK